MGSRLPRLGVVLAIVLVLALVAVAYLWVRIRSDAPVVYADIEDHFKYGSTGGERGYGRQLGFGIPYWIWIALPELFSDLLPDGRAGRGWSAFGMLYEADRDPRFDLPIGMSMRRVQGIDRVYFNCASCHTGSVRETPSSEPVHVLGMPANTFDLGQVGLFLFNAAGDRRFTPDLMMLKIEELGRARRGVPAPATGKRPAEYDLLNRLVFRLLGVHLIRDQLLNLRGRLSFVDMAAWGPGRVDTFNSPKALLGFRMERASPEELIGIADFPSVWYQKGREGMQLHWDGNNNSVNERNLSAGYGTGATPTTLDKEKILRTAAYLWDQAAPPPYPEARIDPDLAGRGEPIYRQYCWGCHGNPRPPFEGETVGRVVAIETIGTDRWRLDSYTPELASAQGSLYAGYPLAGEEGCRGREDDTDDCYPARFSHFRKTYGYANMPLDGLWLRAPYLHNGSVPTLRALLAPQAERPALFYLGNEVYDYRDVGFVSDLAEQGGRRLFALDTTAPGNGNQGHEGAAYGTELPAAEKDALLEYLKTF